MHLDSWSVFSSSIASRPIFSNPLLSRKASTNSRHLFNSWLTAHSHDTHPGQPPSLAGPSFNSLTAQIIAPHPLPPPPKKPPDQKLPSPFSSYHTQPVRGSKRERKSDKSRQRSSELSVLYPLSVAWLLAFVSSRAVRGARARPTSPWALAGCSTEEPRPARRRPRRSHRLR